MKTVSETMEFLRAKGFDIEEAMEMCADDTDIYMEVLGTALEEGTRKLPIIENSMRSKDYDRYHIEVHALKNAARIIGAMELSGLAWQQEQTVKDGEYDRVDEEGGLLLERYREVLDTLKIIFED